MNRTGVTAIELLIYIVLFAFVSLLISRQFSTLVNNYSDGKKIARQQTDARDIIGLMMREIKNTGVKIYLRKSAGSYVKDTADGAFITSPDLSSFVHKQGTVADTLTIYKARIKSDGDLEEKDTVTYSIDGTTLKRDLKTTENKKSANSIVSENVYALQFQYGIYGTTVPLLDQTPMTPANWNLTASPSAAVAKSGTSDVLLTFSAAATGELKFNTQYQVKAKCKYSVLLKLSPTGGFPKNVDSLRFCFKNGVTVLASEKFKPYTGDKILTINNGNFTVNADMSLQFFTKGSGSLLVQGVEVTRSGDSSYTWSSNPALADKRNVRAIRVFVLTRSSESAGSAPPTSISMGDIVFTPPPGAHTWRLYEETIEILNNGKF